MAGTARSHGINLNTELIAWEFHRDFHHCETVGLGVRRLGKWIQRGTPKTFTAGQIVLLPNDFIISYSFESIVAKACESERPAHVLNRAYLGIKA